MSLRRFLLPLRIIVSLTLLGYMLWRAEPIKVWESWKNTNPILLVVAVFLQFAGVAISAGKWSAILSARGQKQPYSWLLRTYLVGQFASNFLPTSVGGDAVRAGQLGRRINSYSQASASIFVERVTGFLALSILANLALALAAAGFGAVNTSLSLTLLAILVGVGAVVALPLALAAPRLQPVFERWLPPAIAHPLIRLSVSLAEYTPRGQRLSIVLGISVLYQSLLIVIHLICGWALGINAPLIMYALMVPLTDIVGLAPVFINSLGARELVFTFYLTQIGSTPAVAIGLAFIAFSVRLLVSCIGGCVLLFSGDSAFARKNSPRARSLAPITVEEHEENISIR